jgi:hypothetical protein
MAERGAEVERLGAKPPQQRPNPCLLGFGRIFWLIYFLNLLLTLISNV